MLSSATTSGRHGPSIEEYARWLHVSSDGCRNKFDLDNRNLMLKHIERGYENQWLKV